MTDEMKNKYNTFITKISEILGLGKPVDILKLCETTDLFFRPLEKRIEELEAQVEKMKCCGNCKHYKPVVTVNKSISNMCEDYYDGCNNNIYEPYNKWELKEK